jgi:hypothetical protein
MSNLISNIYLDKFIENLVVFNVKSEDISNYLNYSIQIESTENTENKMNLLESFILDFKTTYVDISQDIEDQINQLRMEILMENFLNLQNK